MFLRPQRLGGEKDGSLALSQEVPEVEP